MPAGIRLKKSEEPATPASNRVEFWYDILDERFRYKREDGVPLDLVSNVELEELRQQVSPISFRKNTFQLSQADIENGYVILSHKALDGSVFAAMDRLVVIEGIDFLVETTEDNRSKIVFINAISNNGDEYLSAGIVLFVQFAVQ